jgi:membrane protein required for colicin V production
MVFELIVVGVILLSIAWGVHRGLAWQLSSIVSLVSGFFIALPLSKPVASLFGSTSSLGRFIAIAGIYALVSAAVFLVTHYYRKAITSWELDKWDDHLGGLLGAIKGYLLCTVVTFFLITLSDKLHDSILRTGMGKLMGETFHVLTPLLPDEVHVILHSHIDDLDQTGACSNRPTVKDSHPDATPDPKGK